MTVSDFGDGTLGDLLDTLVADAFDYTRLERPCRGLPDRDFVREGILRVLSPVASGRDWLQQAAELGRGVAVRGTLFPALHSERRCLLAGEVAAAFARRTGERLAALGVDHLADFPELAPYRCLAADGHTVGHACHAQRRESGSRNPVSCIYTLDLRTGIARPLAPVSGDGGRRHEWPVFESALLAGAGDHGGAEGTIHVLDRAYVDNRFWTLDAKRLGHHVVTRAKSSMLFLMRAPQPFDRADPVNAGVVEYARVGTSNAGTMFLVVYGDPETGQRYEFLSTVPAIRPGLVAWLYFLRWRIEKTFDTFKNDFGEGKAWANGEGANSIQFACIAMAYCFCRLLEARLEAEHGLADEEPGDGLFMAIVA